jgi:hypothetical protein
MVCSDADQIKPYPFCEFSTLRYYGPKRRLWFWERLHFFRIALSATNLQRLASANSTLRPQTSPTLQLLDGIKHKSTEVSSNRCFLLLILPQDHVPNRLHLRGRWECVLLLPAVRLHLLSVAHQRGLNKITSHIILEIHIALAKSLLSPAAPEASSQ